MPINWSSGPSAMCCRPTAASSSRPVKGAGLNSGSPEATPSISQPTTEQRSVGRMRRQSTGKTNDLEAPEQGPRVL